MTQGRKTPTSGTKGSGRRELTVRVLTGKKRTVSSKLWLQRQLNDPYVSAAKRDGFRSRAAYKLSELDDKYRILKPGQVVVDLGAAPGGWSQVSAARVKAEGGNGAVIAIDLTEIAAIPGVVIIHGDFLEEASQAKLTALLAGRRADVLLSDMAAPSSGHRQTDHLRIMGLCEEALAFAADVLAPDGAFLAKVLQGGAEQALLDALKRDFKLVRHVKPKASRADSAELYVLATGFRGGANYKE
ncbi:MAG: RlmE family RNA methyltransferase [Hyphomicrobiales bacterium]|nr:RlmE family RNA methyltransferase [Hyphomicrobiales bacterium]